MWKLHKILKIYLIIYKGRCGIELNIGWYIYAVGGWHLTALSSAGINDYEKSIHIRIWMNQSGLGEWELQSIVNTKEISALFCSFYLSSFLLQIQSRRKHKLFFASSKYFYPGGVPEQLQVPADPHHQVSAARGLRHLSLHLQKLHRPGGGGGWALWWDFKHKYGVIWGI